MNRKRKKCIITMSNSTPTHRKLHKRVANGVKSPWRAGELHLAVSELQNRITNMSEWRTAHGLWGASPDQHSSMAWGRSSSLVAEPKRKKGGRDTPPRASLESIGGEGAVYGGTGGRDGVRGEEVGGREELRLWERRWKGAPACPRAMRRRAARSRVWASGEPLLSP